MNYNYLGFRLKTLAISILSMCFFYRLAMIVSIIIFSLSWKYGVLIATTSICLIVFIIPSLAMLYNGVQCCNHRTSLADRSILFIPVPSFQQNDFLEDPEQNTAEKILKSRIKNKLVAGILIVLVSTLQFLITKEIIPFSQTDLW